MVQLLNLKKKLLGDFNLHTVIRMPGSVFSPYTSITTNILFFDRPGPTEETWFCRLDMPEGYKHFSKTRPMKPEHFAPAVEWWSNRRELTVDGFAKAKKFTARQLAKDLKYNGVKSFTGTAGQQRIHKDYLPSCPFPLPPLAEQARIVARLKELLPLCERLR